MRRPTLAPVAAVVLAVVLIPAAYMGAYYAMLEEAGIALRETGEGPGEALMGEIVFVPEYRNDSRTIAAFFWPAHQIDRRIRPHVWKSWPDPQFDS